MDALIQVARLWLCQQRTAEAGLLLQHVATAAASTETARSTARALLAKHAGSAPAEDAALDGTFSLADVLMSL